MKLAKPQEVKRTIKVIQSLSRYLEPKNVNLRINEKGKVSLLNIMLQIYEKKCELVACSAKKQAA